MTNLFSSNIIMLFVVIFIFIIALYVLSIFWTIKDAKERGANWKTWGLVSIIPFIGALIYVIFRPQLLLIDKKEQELDIALKKRQLMKYGECAKCGCEVKDNYIVCPNCQQKLKDVCVSCHNALDFKWTICPYCGTPKANSAINNSGFDNNKKNTEDINIKH